MRKQFTALALLTAVFTGCGAAATQIDPVASDKQYLLGADYFQKGMVAPALEELLKSVQLNPENADAHNLLGLVFLRKAAESEDMATRIQCLKGEELRLEKDQMEDFFKKADEQFKKAVDIKQNFSEALNNLAVVALHFGRYDDAIQAEQKALANIVYREPFAAQGNLGLAYYNKKDLARAAQALRQALFDQPGFCVGRFRLAKVYAEQGEWDQAAAELEKVTGDKSCPIQEAFHLAGMVALRRQEREKAADFFERCVTLAQRSCLARECKLAKANQ